MMDPTYYLASLKLSAWMSRSGQYNTDIKQAREFTHGEVIAMAKRQKEGGNIVVPVAKSDMELLG